MTEIAALPNRIDRDVVPESEQSKAERKGIQKMQRCTWVPRSGEISSKNEVVTYSGRVQRDMLLGPSKRTQKNIAS